MSIAEPLQPLTTIRDFIRWGCSEFSRNELSFGHGFADAFDEARYLVLHRLNLTYDFPEAYFDTVLTLAERERVLEILQLRISLRRPAAYLTNASWFCGLEFYVDERVLVPRSPLAEVIGNQFEPWIDRSRVHRILDLCTGSGCIAIAAQYQFPDAAVCAADISRDALDVAAINLARHELNGRIALYESDLLQVLPALEFDVIVCNPPYVDAKDMAALTAEFRCEPETGLRAGTDGLDLVARILQQAEPFLSEDGIMFIEVGNSQAALENKYGFLPMTWIEFEMGGSGVCCIEARDLKRQSAAIMALAS